MAEQDQTQTEEIQTLYAYIGKLHRALCTTMDTVANTYDNGENCPHCGVDYHFNDEKDEYMNTCENADCDGNEAQNVLNEVSKAYGQIIYPK